MITDGFKRVTSRGANFYGPFTIVYTENGDILTKAKRVADEHMRAGGKGAVILENEKLKMCMVKLYF